MEIIVLLDMAVYIVLIGIVTFSGLNLRIIKNWLYGVLGFVCGFLIGYLKTGISLGVQMGLMLGFVLMFNGAMMYRHYQMFNK